MHEGRLLEKVIEENGDGFFFIFLPGPWKSKGQLALLNSAQ